VAMRHIVLPIERLPERYSDQWWTWLKRSARRLEMELTFIGDDKRREIRLGQFLDVYETNVYKAEQLAEALRFIRACEPEGVSVLVCDGWFPGIEALAYVRDNAKRKIRITAILHAGSYDPWDFLAQNGVGRWGAELEASWFRIYDRILVGSEFHKRMLVRRRGALASKICVVPWPVHVDAKLRARPKKPWVVFPHRLAPEKQPEDFDALREALSGLRLRIPGLRFVRSVDVCANKSEYYDLLSQCRVAFSSARQETFGIAMQEAVNLGCFAVAPRRLSYPETLPAACLYRDINEAARMTARALLAAEHAPLPVRYTESMDEILRRFIVGI
jgi:hypothetical protein